MTRQMSHRHSKSQVGEDRGHLRRDPRNCKSNVSLYDRHPIFISSNANNTYCLLEGKAVSKVTVAALAFLVR